MGIFDKITCFLHDNNVAEADDADFSEEYDEGYEEEEEYEEEPAETYAPPQQRMRTTRVVDRGNKVVSIHADSQLQVVIVRPRKFDEVGNIANHIRERRTVVLNLERTEKVISRRIVDFLSGAAYVFDGKFKRIADNTYIITPNTVGVLGAEAVDNETASMYYEYN